MSQPSKHQQQQQPSHHHKTNDVVHHVLQTKPSHESALALLLQTLGPCFQNENEKEDSAITTTTNTAAKQQAAGLYCIVGAIQGCRTVGLSLQFKQTLGRFLLEYVGPLNLTYGDATT